MKRGRRLDGVGYGRESEVQNEGAIERKKKEKRKRGEKRDRK